MNKLYAGGPELRLRQEWILGVGGVRVLRAMGIDPAVWHANEGHAAFMMVERLRELIVAGAILPGRRARGPGAERLHHPHPGSRRPRCVHGRAARGLHRAGMGGNGDRSGNASSVSAPTPPCRDSFT